MRRALLTRVVAGLAGIGASGGSGGGASPSLVPEEENKDIFLTGEIKTKWPGINMLYVKAGGAGSIMCESRLTSSRLAWKRKSGEIVKELGPKLVLDSDVDKSGAYLCFSQKHAEWKPVEAFVVVASPQVTITSNMDKIQPNVTTSNLLLDCKRPGSEQSPVWYHNGRKLDTTERLIEDYSNGSVLIKYVNSMHSGIYHCAYEPEDGKGTTIYGWIPIKAEGYVHQGHAVSKNMMEGEDVNLECEVYGYPVPEVNWNVAGKDLDVMNRTEPPGRFILSAYKGVQNARLTVKRLIFDDREKYYCCAHNYINSPNSPSCEYTMVRVKDKLAALWPFLGIVAEVIILVTIIFIYEKRRASKEAAEDNDAPEHKHVQLDDDEETEADGDEVDDRVREAPVVERNGPGIVGSGRDMVDGTGLRVPPTPIITYDKAARIREHETIWADGKSVVHRLPEHFKKRYWLEWVLADVQPVHYRPPQDRWEWDERRGVWLETEHRPILPIYPPEADNGLWGGEGVVKGFYVGPVFNKKRTLPRKWVADYWWPELRREVVYSETLNAYMSVIVTPRLLDLVDQHYGLDLYLLETRDIDLHSALGRKLKREVCLAITEGLPAWEHNKERQELLIQKYAEHKLPKEEAEWVGLTLNEAAVKQQDLEEELSSQTSIPYKDVLEMLLVRRLESGEGEEAEDARDASFLSNAKAYLPSFMKRSDSRSRLK